MGLAGGAQANPQGIPWSDTLLQWSSVPQKPKEKSAETMGGTIILATGVKAPAWILSFTPCLETKNPVLLSHTQHWNWNYLIWLSILHVIFVSEKQELPALKQTSPSYQQGCLLCLGSSAALSTQCHLPSQPTASGDSSFKTVIKQRKRLYKLKCNLPNRTVNCCVSYLLQGLPGCKDFGQKT